MELAHPHVSSRLGCSHFFLELFQNLTGTIVSVAGDVPINSEALVVILSISRICRLRISEVLIEVGLRMCIYRGERACVYVSVCVCTVFLKNCLTSSLRATLAIASKPDPLNTK